MWAVGRRDELEVGGNLSYNGASMSAVAVNLDENIFY